MTMPDPSTTNSRTRRVLNLANIGSLLLGATVFVALAMAWDTFAGVLVAAAAAAVVTGLAWWLWVRANRPDPTEIGLR